MTNDAGYKVGSMKGAFWWIDRWRSSNSYASMNAEERGVYRELIDELWLRDGVIGLNEQWLSNLAGGEEVWKRVRGVVLARFVKTKDGYKHVVHDEVFSKARSFKKAQQDKGLKRSKSAVREGGRFVSAGDPAGISAGEYPPAVDHPTEIRDQRSGDLDLPATEIQGEPVCFEAVDEERVDMDREEMALLKHLMALQDSGADVQAIVDSLPRPAGMAPFNAHRALVGGKSGIPRTPGGLTVRQRLNDALEARQRAQSTPYVSEKNKTSFDAIDRVLGTGAFADAKAKQIGGTK